MKLNCKELPYGIGIIGKGEYFTFNRHYQIIGRFKSKMNQSKLLELSHDKKIVKNRGKVDLIYLYKDGCSFNDFIYKLMVYNNVKKSYINLNTEYNLIWDTETKN